MTFVRKWLCIVLSSAAALAIPSIAAAQSAISAKAVNLRAGPGREYPRVTWYDAGAPLQVQGCTDGYGWCDVIGPDGQRGWIYAGNIHYPYQQSYVGLPYYGPQLGIPIVAFSIGAYWGSYYQSRPFYRSYPRYEHHRPPPRPVWRPQPGHGPSQGFRPPPGGHRPPPGVRPPAVRPPPQQVHRPSPRPPQVSRPAPPSHGNGGPRPGGGGPRPGGGAHPGGGHGR
ncbi:hypothetical protein BH09PSE6_BH09PSE6_21150 [soil metagenome]